MQWIETFESQTGQDYQGFLHTSCSLQRRLVLVGMSCRHSNQEQTKSWGGNHNSYTTCRGHDNKSQQGQLPLDLRREERAGISMNSWSLSCLLVVFFGPFIFQLQTPKRSSR
ncbi:Alkaline phosphatase [Fusarium oxysporum f. sp. albedinis]|nr:Alkaline phosphatase [Fusarium oxysporum f. sp. albedinis]